MYIDNEVELNKQIKTDNLPSVWLIFGSEDYLKARYRSEIVKRIITSEDCKIDYSEFDMPFLDVSELADCLQFWPLAASRRVAVLTGFDPEKMLSDDFDLLLETADNTPDSALFVICANENVTEKQARFKKFSDVCKKRGVCAFLGERKRSDLAKFVKSELKKFNATAENDVCYKIVDMCNCDMEAISNECAKLGAYSTGGAVSLACVTAMVSMTVEESVFDMVKSIIAGNGVAAAKKLSLLLDNGSQPIEITAAIISGYTDLQKAVSAKRSGVDLREACSALGYTPKNSFRLERAWGQTSHMRSDYPGECLQLALETDKACKSRKVDERAMLIKLVSDICLVSTN